MTREGKEDRERERRREKEKELQQYAMLCVSRNPNAAKQLQQVPLALNVSKPNSVSAAPGAAPMRAAHA